MDKKNKTTAQAHDKQHNASKPKSSTTTSSGCKTGSCSTSEKKGKTPHSQDGNSGTC